MSRLDAFLLLALLACALSVVNSTYQQRRVFVDLERAQGQQQSLAQDWTRLQYEQSALSKTSRIEDISSNQLTMSAVSAGRTEYLNNDGTAVPIAPLPTGVTVVKPVPGAAKTPAGNTSATTATATLPADQAAKAAARTAEKPAEPRSAKPVEARAKPRTAPADAARQTPPRQHVEPATSARPAVRASSNPAPHAAPARPATRETAQDPAHAAHAAPVERQQRSNAAALAESIMNGGGR